MEAPRFPWVMAQTWQHVLFAHWGLPPEVLAPLLPDGLEPDLFDRQAWVAVVPFLLDYCPRGLGWTGLRLGFAELNLRTYVRHRGVSGVYFFCLDARDAFSVEMARRFYHLNYLNARMQVRIQDDASTPRIHFDSTRIDTRGEPAQLSVEYGPTGSVFTSQPGSLDHWLTERYRFFTLGPGGRMYTAQLTHEPWPLQPAEWNVSTNTLAEAHGVRLPANPPHLRYARQVSVRAGWLQRLRK